MSSGLVAFLGLCVLITVTPGLDTAVVVRSVLRSGRRAGLRTAVGCAVGLFVHASAVAVGLAQLLVRSQTAFEAVKLMGALFLIVLGARSLWSALQPTPDHSRTTGPAGAGTVEAGSVEAGTVEAGTVEAGPVEAGPVEAGRPFVQGLLTNLSNPKATLFFMASLPQFVPADRPTQAIPVALALASVAVLFSLTGLGLVVLAVHRARRLFDSRRVRRLQEALLGTTLVALGVRVATE